MIARVSFRILALLWLWTGVATPLAAAELVMVEQQGCYYCLQWKKVIAPIYPKTAEGRYAPLRVVDIDDGAPADLTFERRVVYTPTFILIDNGHEVGRIEGYPGEDFFWGLLGMMLKAKTNYAGTG
jgi:hypothetical protein